MGLIPLMIYILHASFNLAMSMTDSEGVTEDYLTAVSSSAGSEKFYTEMKRLHSTRQPKYDNQENKQAICEAVLNSAHFFYHHEVKPVSLSDEWVQKQVKQNFSTVYTDLYSRFFPTFFGDKTKSNPYMERTIFHLDENIQEYVFACAAKKRRSDTLKMYFISYKYNFGCMIEPQFRHIYSPEKNTGRFVFECNEKEGRMNLIALAENPVAVFSFGLYYPSLLQNPFIRAVRRNARFANLTPYEKLRLCSVALNGDAYRGIIRFLSREEDIKTQCENVDLVFHRLSEQEEILSNQTVFKCRAEFIGGHNTSSAIFFISPGDDRSKFFISSQEGNKKVIQKYFFSGNIGTLHQV